MVFPMQGSGLNIPSFPLQNTTGFNGTALGVPLPNQQANTAQGSSLASMFSPVSGAAEGNNLSQAVMAILMMLMLMLQGLSQGNTEKNGQQSSGENDLKIGNAGNAGSTEESKKKKNAGTAGNAGNASKSSDKAGEAGDVGSVESKATSTAAASQKATENVASSNVKGEVVWNGDFENTNWKSAWGVKNASDIGNVELVEDAERGTVMKINYDKGGYGGSSGVTHKIKVAEEGQGITHGKLSFMVKPDKNFLDSRPIGGKLMGLSGGENASGKDYQGSDGWSVRLGLGDMRNTGKIDSHAYTYLPKEPNKDIGVESGTGDRFFEGNWDWKPGEWQNVELEIYTGKPNKEDGFMKVYYNGELVGEQRDIDFGKNGIENINISSFFGGNSSKAAQADTFMLIDDLKFEKLS